MWRRSSGNAMGNTGSTRNNTRETTGRKGFMRSSSRSQTPVMTVKMPVRVASRQFGDDSESSEEENANTNPFSHIFARRKKKQVAKKKIAESDSDSDREKETLDSKPRLSTTSTGLDVTMGQDMSAMRSSRSCLSSNSSRSNPSLPGQPSSRRISWAQDSADEPPAVLGVPHQKVINEGLTTDLAGLPPVANYSLAGKPRRRKARGSMLAVNSDSITVDPPSKRIPQDWIHLLEELKEGEEGRRNSVPAPPPNSGLVGLDVNMNDVDAVSSARGRRGMGPTSSSGSSVSTSSPAASRRSSGAGEAMEARDSARKAPARLQEPVSGGLTGLTGLVISARTKAKTDGMKRPTAASAPTLSPPTLFDDDMRPMVSTSSRTSTAWQERDQEKVVTFGSGALAAMQRSKDGFKKVGTVHQPKKSRLTMFGLMYG